MQQLVFVSHKYIYLPKKIRNRKTKKSNSFYTYITLSSNAEATDLLFLDQSKCEGRFALNYNDNKLYWHICSTSRPITYFNHFIPLKKLPLLRFGVR